MTAWASAHPVLGARLCVIGGVLALLGAFVILFLRLTRDTGERASGERPAREVGYGYVDSSPSALMARIDASLAAAHEAPVEAPGEMPAASHSPDAEDYGRDSTQWTLTVDQVLRGTG